MTVTSGWAINGPSKTQVEDARRLSYTLSGDAHGVATLDDLRVIPMDPPGPGVQVTRGSAMIKSRYDDGETYLGSHNQTVTYATSPTPSNQGRSDLVVMRVEDPWARNSPWPEPADPDATEFFPIRIIEGVAPNTTARHLSEVPGYEHETGIVLYRIDQPANNATVQLSMIKDLRLLANPKRHDVNIYRALDTGEGGTLSVAAGSTALWPPQARVNTFPVRVPEWATVAAVRSNIGGVSGMAGRCWGTVFVTIGPVSTQRCNFVSADFAGEKPVPMRASDTVAIPASLRGTVQNVQLWAAPASPPGASRPVIGEYGSVDLDIVFYEHPSQITS